ncbi:Hypoxanthine phosphoribosyltransferase [Caulifigura coniformis]|uniref:Hypoxanthine phosphoribosyltransferase n=1 Tax=Caulifigura coniformis TaxID=2527983 RepID=A0A517S8Z7_9PLAN|nr:hypoxanthine phosphoribosyltransferase [Caulifigura coniformis]QDT52598.1 Hypoxanthine phosphoribosyltransferase [Caulifigura coniformis]
MKPVRRLISEAEIEASVIQLGRRISDEYRGKPLTVIGILTGSIMLVTDLMRRIDVPHKLGLVAASSYRGDATVAGALKVDLSELPDLAGRHVLVIDDIFDTGRTMSSIVERVKEFAPLSVKSVVLLWKKSRMEVAIGPDYFAFEIPDEFVVGYGLDLDDEYRHLPYIGVVESPVDL